MKGGFLPPSSKFDAKVIFYPMTAKYFTTFFSILVNNG
jgi:hypothetical protein